MGILIIFHSEIMEREDLFFFQRKKIDCHSVRQGLHGINSPAIAFCQYSFIKSTTFNVCLYVEINNAQDIFKVEETTFFLLFEKLNFIK
jgi:hypothetical protein